jgi:hypothetical protein
MNDHEALLREMELHERRRTRRFWILMAILGGLPVLAFGVWISSPLYWNGIPGDWPLKFGPNLLYAGWCSSKVMDTISGRGGRIRPVLVMLLAILFAAISIGLVIGVFYAGCYMITGGRM